MDFSDQRPVESLDYMKQRIKQEGELAVRKEVESERLTYRSHRRMAIYDSALTILREEQAAKQTTTSLTFAAPPPLFVLPGEEVVIHFAPRRNQPLGK